MGRAALRFAGQPERGWPHPAQQPKLKYADAWRDKIAAGFTISGSPSGDKFSTLQYFFTLIMQHGMIWVGLGEMPHQPSGINQAGSFSGVMAQAGQEPTDVAPNAAYKLTGELLGKRVAEYAVKLKKIKPADLADAETQ